MKRVICIKPPSVGRPDVAEVLAMHFRHLLPIFDSREQDSRAMDVLEPRAEFFQGFANDLDAAAGLSRGIAGPPSPHRSPVGPQRRGARDGNEPAGPHAARDADERFIRRTG